MIVMQRTFKYSALLFITLLVMGCNAAKSTSGGDSGSQQLWQHPWELTTLRGTPVEKNERVQPYLLFQQEGSQLSGSLGCNRLAGTFTLEGEQGIRISAVITTKMACPDQDLEYRFSGVLEQIDTWAIDGTSLTLSKGEKVAATFLARDR